MCPFSVAIIHENECPPDIYIKTWLRLYINGQIVSRRAKMNLFIVYSLQYTLHHRLIYRCAHIAIRLYTLASGKMAEVNYYL